MTDERGGRVSHIRDVLAPALERLGPKGLWVESKVRKEWPEMVGDDLAAHTFVVRLRATTLVVGADGDAWATELRYLTGVLMEKLNQRLGQGTITEVVVTKRRGGQA